MNAKIDLIVSRHFGLVQWLAHQLAGDWSLVRHSVTADGLVQEDWQHLEAEWRVTRVVPVLAHVTADDVRGKHVLGVLPLSLARHAASVTEVEMTLRPDQRGKELTPTEMDDAGARLGDPLCVRSLALVLAGVESLRDGTADGNLTADELWDGR